MHCGVGWGSEGEAGEASEARPELHGFVEQGVRQSLRDLQGVCGYGDFGESSLWSERGVGSGSSVRLAIGPDQCAVVPLAIVLPIEGVAASCKTSRSTSPGMMPKLPRGIARCHVETKAPDRHGLGVAELVRAKRVLCATRRSYS